MCEIIEFFWINFQIENEVSPNPQSVMKMPGEWRLTWSILQLRTTNPFSGPAAPRPPGGLLVHGKHEVVLLPAEETVLAEHLSPLSLTATDWRSCQSCAAAPAVTPLQVEILRVGARK